MTAMTITIEPWRSAAFPVIKDLVVDRSAYDKILAGRRLHLGPYGCRAGCQQHSHPDVPMPTLRMDAAACIGCGACAGDL